MESTGKVKTAASHLSPLFAGATAGLSVDVTLYPLDTLKTRLQSQQGFYKAGLLTVATSSMPTTALFFMSYEATKSVFQPMVLPHYAPLVHMLAASIGETLACLIRVPTEIAKQRKQTYTGTEKRSSIRILLHAFKTEGLRKGVYRGFLSTVVRDLPFSFIELPLWELLKTSIRDRNDGNISSFQSAMCGSLAGGLAAAATTPLDLAKTRIMLAEDYACTRKLRIKPVLSDIYGQAGVRGLFAGAAPRTTAFMLGGFVFFGVYEHSKGIFDRYFDR
ncbi:jg9588 [Pararge aegeria aegeria]|uniref:Jg9588 protein n=1 Tax=Pararge aegeria aegeria TaxID=348720 RepID=A0A8S4S8L7_9NEOP|nr:jg9588 [Pararge aegeria aegeria]